MKKKVNPTTANLNIIKDMEAAENTLMNIGELKYDTQWWRSQCMLVQ